MPLFSIIIPVYNVEKYIKDCLESVIKQDFFDWEIILIDDGSPDNCPKICDEYKSRGNRIKVLHQNNAGLSEARNAGIRIATGKYLLFLDSDDFLVGINALQKLSKPLKEQSPDLLMYLTTEYDAEGKNIVLQHAPAFFPENRKFSCIDIFNKLYELNGIWVTMAQTKIIHRDFLLNNNLFFKAGIYHEDDEWITRVLQSCPEVAFSFDAVYGYRHRENSIITAVDPEKLYKRACDKVVIGSEMLGSEYIKKNPAYAKYAARYFLGAISQANRMDTAYRNYFLKYLKAYNKDFVTMSRIKNKYVILCSFVEQVFGYNVLLHVMKLVVERG